MSIHLNKMRIGYDIRPFLKEETGVGVYFRNLLAELAVLDAENEYYLFSSSWKDRFDRSRLPSFRKGGFRDLRWPVRAVNFFWYKLGRPRLDSLVGTKLDLTHSPTPIILPTGGKKIVTVCDLFFMEFPGRADREARRHFLKGTRRSLEKADGVITISEFTKKALIETFGLSDHKIKVTYLGLNGIYHRPAAAPGELESARRAFDLPSEYMLFVGASEPRKNLLTLIDALDIVHQKYERIPLVLAGRKGDDHENLLARIAARKVEPWIRILGYLSDRELRSVYQAASALIFPSYCEGFGLPLIEAMACEVPVIASGVTAMPEVAGAAALYFDPRSPDDMAEKIIRVLRDDELRRDLITKGRTRALDFRWGKTAAETLAFYRSVMDSP